ncbi:MAG: hypothetical protein HOC72_23045 [Rhodospirillaceae bacterium]|nr:hypothetical protein [Rhodospirillaceae bacterium]
MFGDKREITFLGGDVNTTARIEQVCSDLDRSFLISADYLAMTDMSVVDKLEGLGGVQLRSKEEVVELFALTI